MNGDETSEHFITDEYICRGKCVGIWCRISFFIVGQGTFMVQNIILYDRPRYFTKSDLTKCKGHDGRSYLNRSSYFEVV